MLGLLFKLFFTIYKFYIIYKFFIIDNLGFTKLLVAAGQYNGSRSDKAEILDLSSDGLTCSDFQNFPFIFDVPIGGLFDLETVKVCGGNYGTIGFENFFIYYNFLQMA
jgi:hypothetical protein